VTFHRHRESLVDLTALKSNTRMGKEKELDSYRILWTARKLKGALQTPTIPV